jgi:predicted nucleic acid-binding Zn ribbon protein
MSSDELCTGGGDLTTPGDKPVDSVDKPARGYAERSSIPPVTAQSRTGADLARAALEAAKQSAKARGRMPARNRGTAGRGQPRRRGWSGARPDDRDPQQFGRLVSRIAIDRGWSEQLRAGAVFGRWCELVGAEIAEHAVPLSLREGELTVQAVSTAWATQLRLLQRDLLARIAAGTGRGVVTRLRIHGPSAPSWRHGSRHVPGRGPRDTYG